MVLDKKSDAGYENKYVRKGKNTEGVFADTEKENPEVKG